MSPHIALVLPRLLAQAGYAVLPTAIAHAGARAGERFIKFFTANIRNQNIRLADARAVYQFFDWCEAQGLRLQDLTPTQIARYLERHPGATPTVKQHLAAIRRLFDDLVSGRVLPMNPASSVRGPKHVVKHGKTLVLTAHEARQFLNSIETNLIVGLPMHRNDVLEMIKRRARDVGLPPTTCCHTFRATGITAYLDNGGTIERAQVIAAHECPARPNCMTALQLTSRGMKRSAFRFEGARDVTDRIRTHPAR